MNREILDLIAGDTVVKNTLRRLVATWPSVVRSEESDVTSERWARVADVDVSLVERFWDQLFETGLCNPDGSIAEEAATYIRALTVITNDKRRR